MSLSKAGLLAVLIAFNGVAQATSLEDLEAEAKKDPSLKIASNGLNYANVLMEAFHKKYPFIQMTQAKLGPTEVERIYQIYDDENAANRADVQFRCQQPEMIRLVDWGWLEKMTSLPNWNRRPSRVEEGDYFVFFLGAPHVLAFNSKLIKEEDLPQSYDELTDPKWKGKIVVRNPLKGNSGAFLVEYIDATHGGMDWFRKMGENQIAVAESGDIVHQMVNSGKKPIGLSRDVEVLKYQAEGMKNLRIHFLKRELGLQFQAVQINARAPHPAAAQLFANWVLSEEAQEVLVAKGYAIGAREKEIQKDRKVWTMDSRKVLFTHHPKLHKALRLLKNGQLEGAPRWE